MSDDNPALQRLLALTERYYPSKRREGWVFLGNIPTMLVVKLGDEAALQRFVPSVLARVQLTVLETKVCRKYGAVIPAGEVEGMPLREALPVFGKLQGEFST